MADILLTFGVDPSSFGSIKAAIEQNMAKIQPKIQLQAQKGSIDAAYKAYQRLNGILENTVKEYDKISNGVNPNKAQYTAPLEAVIGDLKTIKVLFQDAFDNGTAATQVKAIVEMIDQVVAKRSEIMGAFNLAEGGDPMATLKKGTAEYEQNLGRVEDRLRSVGELQVQLKDGAKVADPQTVQDVDALADGFQKLNSDIQNETISAKDARAEFERLSRTFADLRSKTTNAASPVKLLGDDPTKLANTMGEVQRMMSKVADMQDKISLGKGIASPETVSALNNMRSSLQQFSTEMKDMPADQAAQKVAELRAKIIELNGNVRASTSIFNNFFGGMGAGIKSYLAMTLSWTRIIMTTVQELKQMVDTSIELNSAFTQLQIVTRVSDTEMGSFSKTLADTAKNMSASVKDMAEVATVYARLGYSLDESNVLAQYTAMLQNVGDIDSGAASDALTAIVKAYGKGVDDIEELMDKMVEVGNNFPISVSQIAEGMNNAASMMANAGMSFDQSVAMLTAANTTVQNISKSSTGLRTIIARLRNVKSELDEAGEVWNEAKYQELISALTKGGVDLQDATGALRNPYDVLKELSERWSSLTSDVKAAITTALAGTRQQDIFASLMNQFGEATRAMDAMADSAGSLEGAYAIFEDSMQGHINTLKAAFQELSMEAVDKGLVNSFVDLGTSIIESLTPVVGILGQILKYIGPVGAGLAVVAGLNFKNISEFVSAWRGIDSMQRLLNPVESLGMAFGKTGAEAIAFGESLIAVSGAVAAVVAAYVLLDKAIFTSDEAIKRAEKSARAYDTQSEKVNNLNNELETTQDRINELLAKGSLSIIEQQELNDLEEANAKLREQLEVEKEIAQYKQGAAAHDANEALTNPTFGLNWKTGVHLSPESTAIDTTWIDNRLSEAKTIIDYVKAEHDVLEYLDTYEEELYAKLAGLTPGTREFNLVKKQIENLKDIRAEVESDISQNMDTVRSEEKMLYDNGGNVVAEYESTARAISDMWDYIKSDADKALEAQQKIDSFLSKPTLQEYVGEAKQAFSDAGEAMSASEFAGAFPEIAKQAEESGLEIVDVINSIASSVGTINFDDVRNQLKSLKPDKSRSWVWNDWIDSLDKDKIKKLYDAWQSGIDWSSWERPDFESFFEDVADAAEDAKIPIEDLSNAFERFDAVEVSLNDLKSAFDKLSDGSLELGDVIDLVKEFPELAEYVDLTADNFGDLDKGLQVVARDVPSNLINSLREFAETADLTDAQRQMILGLSDSLNSLRDTPLDSLVDKYGELADEVRSAKSAVDELNDALGEDTNTGYTTRAKAMEEMMDLMKHGAIGSESKLWKIADSFGLSEVVDFSNDVEEAADQLYDLIVMRQRWYDGATDDGYSSKGIQKFVDDVANMSDALEEYGVQWEYVGDELQIDIPDGEFVDFAHAIGMSSDELVDMLIQLGQFLGINWRDIVPEELQTEVDVTANTDSAQQEIEALEAGGETTIDVEANKKPADMAMAEWRAEQKDNTATVQVKTDNSGVDEGVAEAQAAVSNAVAEPMTLDVDASPAIEKTVNTQKLINSLHGKTVTVNVKVNGTSNLQSAINKISQIKDKSVTITTYNKNVNRSVVQVNGTAHAGGNWSTKRTERALTGELGPEIVVDPSTGRWYTVGDNGAEFVRIPKGSIVFNHKQSEALLKNGRATGRGSALAEGTAYVSASGSFGNKYKFSSSSSKTSSSSGYSSSNKTSSKTATSSSTKTELENWFEKLYAYHQHLLAMEQESQEDYFIWLEDAYKRAYKDGTITIEDFYKYQEEVFQGLRDIYADYLDDVEHEVSMREHFKGEEQAILKLYQDAIDSIKEEIDEARAIGLRDTDEYLQGLQDRYWTLYDALEDMRNSYTENAKSATDELISLRKDMIKQDLKAEKDANNERIKNLKEFYKKQKELLKNADDEEKYLKEQAQKRKSVTDIQMELDRLSYDNSAWAQKRRLELEEDLAKAQEDLMEFEKDHALDVAQNQLDELYEMQEAAYNQQNDLLDEKLNNAKALYDQALNDVREGSIDLYNEMIEYNNIYGDGISQTIVDKWNEAYEALNDYANLYGKTYNDISLSNATGYNQAEKSDHNAAGSWDTHPISDKGTSVVAPSEPEQPKTTNPYGKPSELSMPKAGYYYKGYTGNGVRAIQHALNELGYNVTADGEETTYYGKKTYAAMAQFKQDYGVVSYYNGNYGPGTAEKFKELGYASGTKNAGRGIRRIDERGDEYVFESSNGNRYRMFSGGEKVLNAKATNFLYQFATSGGKILTDLIASSIGRSGFDNITNSKSIGEIAMGDIIINGNADQRTVSQIRREQRDGIDYVLTQFAKLKA